MTGIEHPAGTRPQGDGRSLPPSQVTAIVEIAARAPSLYNTQPWRFRASGDALEIYSDRSRRLAAVDPAGREMLIGCGAAAYGARLAARWFGYRPVLTLLPDPRQPDLLVRLRLGGHVPATARERELLAAVPHRHTRRGPFTADPLPAGLLAGLQHDAVAEGAVLVLVERPADFQRLADLAVAAVRWQRRDELVRGELARWTRPPGSEARDGVPAWAYPARPGILRPAPAAGRLPSRDFDLGRSVGRGQSGGAAPAATAILVTAGDSAADWLRAGQALHRILLHAASRWVFASMHTEMLESAGLRGLVSARLGLRSAPQVVLQLGAARSAPATPRRPVTELLSWE